MYFRIAFLSFAAALSAEPISVSGIYPSLAMFNNEGECGTGGVVPWADRLWVITYGPHLPMGSSDKLYEITPDLTQIVRPESIGGTPANRMIHEESGQLFLGPYAIDDKRQVRAIPYKTLFGRHTGLARHLDDPSGKIVFASMEEGITSVDVKTLAPQSLWLDEQVKAKQGGKKAELPGYHGKGFYSTQGRYVYANNGEHGQAALVNPTTPSGVLAEWDGKADQWSIVRRNQFTEVTGPGGIRGGKPADPLWCVGWDHRSLILMLLDGGTWSSFRLPKVSHSYDGAHGWNTEWPRIRDVGAAGKPEYLMTMHGAFWSFPGTFSAAQTTGIRVQSAYLKVIGDFARWKDQLVFGCDDSAKSEFLNKRSVKGGIDSVGQSQSNLWFTSPETPSNLGPAPASGAVWLREAVVSGQAGDPFLVAGWKHRSLWLIDHGAGKTQRRDITETGDWLSLKAELASKEYSAVITLSNGDARTTQADPIFQGLATANDATALRGVFRPRGENKRTLAYATDHGYYEMGADLKLKRVEDPKAEAFTRKAVAIPQQVVTLDNASVLVEDDKGRRWRLPRATQALDAATNAGELRICREVATERDMLSVCGTFFELPAENADGFAKLRPVASHNCRITDFGGYRGLFVLSGLQPNAPTGEHIVRSEDGKAALWLGAVDDLWKLGKPRGAGGPWKDSAVKAGEPSDAYLCWAYDKRTLTLSHDHTTPVEMELELDLTGTGLWVSYEKFTVQPAAKEQHTFPDAVQARWLRLKANHDCKATAWLTYE
jgi:hypothetical protein